MAASIPSTQHDIPRTRIEEFPAFKSKDCLSIASQIAEHLKRLLGRQSSSITCRTILPSSIELAEFYRCSALDVLDGLYHLKNQHYEYIMSGLDSEITLYGPTSLQKPTCTHFPQWQYPWEGAHKVTETPIVPLFRHLT